ncbi:arginine repressor [Demequina subtropica]|uniref:arginine repressor n=1 Tax=Demequina subtropica TaxID=1638989 RepID=UPI0007807878|nr:arginine repressor [Demequina subtropica]
MAGAAMSVGVPQTKAARQALVRHLIETQQVESQTQLAAMLEAEGLHATQATLSRDLVEIGAIKVRGADGKLMYATQAVLESIEDTGARLNRLCAELLHSAAGSANLTVLRTPEGAAQFLAMAIDSHDDPDLLGTVAGDDTIIVIATDPLGGERLASKFLDRASGLHS